MNKRILELAEQAAESSSWKPGLGNEHVQKYFQEFAELIVQMCANIVRNSSLPDSYSEACLEYIADELEEYFGVE